MTARRYQAPTDEEFARRCLRVSMEATHDRAWVMERHGDESSQLHELRLTPGETGSAWRNRIESCVTAALRSVFGDDEAAE